MEYETYARGTQREYSSNIALLNIADLNGRCRQILIP